MDPGGLVKPGHDEKGKGIARWDKPCFT